MFKKLIDVSCGLSRKHPFSLCIIKWTKTKLNVSLDFWLVKEKFLNLLKYFKSIQDWLYNISNHKIS